MDTREEMKERCLQEIERQDEEAAAAKVKGEEASGEE